MMGTQLAESSMWRAWETEDEMVGWHYQLHRHKLEQTLGGNE